MYLLDLCYENARCNGTGRISFRGDGEDVREWTVLDSGPEGLELLRLLALTCVGHKHLEHLPIRRDELVCREDRDLKVEAVAVQHAPRDCLAHTRRFLGTAFSLSSSGRMSFPSPALSMHPGMRRGSLGMGSGVRRDFAVGYGSRLTAHRGTDCFDFTGPGIAPRARRFGSLFGEDAEITDPVAFLSRLSYRARRGRLPAVRLLAVLRREFQRTLGLSSGNWVTDSRTQDEREAQIDWRAEWDGLDAAHQAVLLPVLDAVRHMVDASPHELDPLARPGVMLLDTPDVYCPQVLLAAWIGMLDRLFPRLQFVVTLPEHASLLFPASMGKRTLPVRDECTTQPTQPTRSRPRLSAGTALLVDVDGRMPNVALMKLSAHLARDGWKRELARGAAWRRQGAERVLASCVFDFESSHRRVAQMREYYGDKLTLGGSGVDLDLRLPPEIESGPADYDLYSELHDRAVGFLTRGCPRHCPFCIVPRKEGRPRQVAELGDLLQGNREKLILLDDNLLAHPDADRLLQEMAERRLQVNFNQTLDIRLIDTHRARLLKTIRCSNPRFTRRNYHFSLNHARELDLVRRKYDLFGFTQKDNVEFVCMYGYDTSLADDVRRFAFLKSLPRAYVFVQRYRPVSGRQATVAPESFFRGNADKLIDELIGIVFTQNMKSMEVYYRWLSARYFGAFGKLHLPLVDTLFRYNHRDEKGAYIASMLASGEARRRGCPETASRGQTATCMNEDG